MATVKKATSFVKQVMARLQGDEDQVVAERNYRKADSAVKGQVSALNSKKIDLEVTLEEAVENLLAAKYPVSLIKDTGSYIRNIADKQEKVDAATVALEEVEDSLEYFINLGAEFNS